MKRTNIDIVRQSITKVTRMLAGINVKVTQRGDQAFVQYNKHTGAVERVNIPNLPDNASDDLIAAVQGYLDHEVAHVLFTDPHARVGDHEPKAKQIDKLHNMVEDCWIEPKMIKAYKGSAFNLANVRRLVFQKRMGESIAKRIAFEGVPSEPQAVKCYLVALLRALAGHEECVEFFDEHDIWSFFPTVLPALQPFFKSDLDACENSSDTLALARKVFDAIVSDEDEDDEDETGSGEPEESDDDTSEKDKDDDGKDEDKSKGKKEKNKDEDDDEGDGGACDDKEEGDDSSEGEAGDKSDDKESDPKGGDADDADDADAPEGDSSEGEDKEEQKRVKVDLEDAMLDMDDFDDAAKDMVIDLFGYDLSKAGDWVLFTNDGDIVETFKPGPAYVPGMKTQMFDSVGRHIGPMQKGLERLLLSRKRSSWEAGRRSGRLNPSGLHRLKTGDDRVFRRKIETRLKNTAVSLLVDCSGSMGRGHSSRLIVAFEAAYALAATLERCRIPTQVAGFTTKSMPTAMQVELRDSERRAGVRYSVIREVAYHPLFKTWQERMTSEVTDRFAAMRFDTNRIISENIDPISVEWAAKDLMKRQEERKVLFVLSDGSPAYQAPNYGMINAAGRRLKEIVQSVGRAGIETVAIGIQTESVRKFYPRSVVINETEDLPKAVMGELRSILLK
ncbi:MAG: hypothetical protein KI788_02420 [Mameliella sp.]|nr:hypothetical protein [Mameliella sp.]